MNKNQLVNGNISTTLLKFAIPFLCASLLQALYGAADLFVAGQFADSASVSAVAIGSQVMQTITGIVLGIAMGCTVSLGQCVGARDERNAARTIGCSVIVFLILAAVLTPVMLILSNYAVAVMQTPQEAVAETKNYIIICSCGIPFIIGYNVVSGIFRGLGDSKTPLYFIIIACILNICLDFLFVAGLGLGAGGAALATVIAQGISFLCAYTYMLRKGFPFEFQKSDLAYDRIKAKKLFQVGLPLALQDALVNVSFLIITAIINTLGLTASASVGVVEKIIVFAMLPTSAFASAVAAMTAQNIGAKRDDRAKRCLKWGIAFSLVFGTFFCIYSQLFPQTITSIFTADPKVIFQASGYLRSYSIDCILVCFVFCINSYFSGSGNSAFPMLHSLIATFLVRIPVSYGMSKIAGASLYRIGLAAPLASLVSIVICFGYFHYKKKVVY